MLFEYETPPESEKFPCSAGGVWIGDISVFRQIARGQSLFADSAERQNQIERIARTVRNFLDFTLRDRAADNRARRINRRVRFRLPAKRSVRR